MESEYELVVIGSATAAMGAAMRVREAGWRVAVIDFRPYGGTCALRGSDPKKMLVGGAEAIDHARRMHGKGVTGDTSIEWDDLPYGVQARVHRSSAAETPPTLCGQRH